MELENLKNTLVSFIKSHAGDKPVVIGLSGGLDSSVVAFLAVEALGNDKVYAVISPSAINTDQDRDLAILVARILKIKVSAYDIEPILETYKNILDTSDRRVIGNLKARIRMSLLYAKANELDALVLGTGNKTELLTGYFTKYGDGGVDLLPIGDLYKTEERELARFINIPKEIIDRPPTAGLWEGQTDEAEMGITYEILDQILMAIEHEKNLDEFKLDDVEKVKKMMASAQHKLVMPPICKVL